MVGPPTPLFPAEISSAAPGQDAGAPVQAGPEHQLRAGHPGVAVGGKKGEREGSGAGRRPGLRGVRSPAEQNGPGREMC